MWCIYEYTIGDIERMSRAFIRDVSIVKAITPVT